MSEDRQQNNDGAEPKEGSALTDKGAGEDTVGGKRKGGAIQEDGAGDAAPKRDAPAKRDAGARPRRNPDSEARQRGARGNQAQGGRARHAGATQQDPVKRTVRRRHMGSQAAAGDQAKSPRGDSHKRAGKDESGRAEVPARDVRKTVAGMRAKAGDGNRSPKDAGSGRPGAGGPRKQNLRQQPAGKRAAGMKPAGKRSVPDGKAAQNASKKDAAGKGKEPHAGERARNMQRSQQGAPVPDKGRKAEGAPLQAKPLPKPPQGQGIAAAPEAVDHAERPQEYPWTRLRLALTSGFQKQGQSASSEIVRVDYRRKSRKRVVAIAAVTVVVAAYLGLVGYSTTHFAANTVIDGVDCSFKTVAQAEDALRDHAASYEIVVKEREGGQEVLKGSKFDYKYVSDGAVQELFDRQNPLAVVRLSADTVQIRHSYSDKKLGKRIAALDCVDTDKMVKVQNAKVVLDGDHYVVQPEVVGTTLDVEGAAQAIEDAIEQGDQTINLEDAGVYENPEVYADDERLQKKIELYNQYVPYGITYKIGKKPIVLDGNKIYGWLDIKDDGKVSVNEDKVREWVKTRLADEYDTLGGKRSFTDGNGDEATVEGGTYGWQLDQEAEVDAILDAIGKQKSVEREPEWLSEAASHGKVDWGDTYAEVSITDQHMWYFKDGKLKMDCDIKTGLPIPARATPAGVFYIMDKQSPYVMHGDNNEYVTPCSWWMRVTGNGVGFHDAWWTGDFGGSAYQYSGSHGCINMSSSMAEELYGMISVGDPVVIHY